jgi:hypothetical protein
LIVRLRRGLVHCVRTACTASDRPTSHGRRCRDPVPRKNACLRSPHGKRAGLRGRQRCALPGKSAGTQACPHAPSSSVYRKKLSTLDSLLRSGTLRGRRKVGSLARSDSSSGVSPINPRPGAPRRCTCCTASQASRSSILANMGRRRRGASRSCSAPCCGRTSRGMARHRSVVSPLREKEARATATRGRARRRTHARARRRRGARRAAAACRDGSTLAGPTGGCFWLDERRGVPRQLFFFSSPAAVRPPCVNACRLCFRGKMWCHLARLLPLHGRLGRRSARMRSKQMSAHRGGGHRISRVDGALRRARGSSSPC